MGTVVQPRKGEDSSKYQTAKKVHQDIQMDIGHRP